MCKLRRFLPVFAENRNVFCHVPSKKIVMLFFLTDAVLMPAKVFPGGDMSTLLMPPLFFLLNLLHGCYGMNTTRCLKRGRHKCLILLQLHYCVTIVAG